MWKNPNYFFPNGAYAVMSEQRIIIAFLIGNCITFDYFFSFALYDYHQNFKTSVRISQKVPEMKKDTEYQT